MAEQNPFTYRHGHDAGRLVPSSFIAQDGQYVFVLGSENQHVHAFKSEDYIALSQSLDLTDINVVRVDAGFKQPTNMPIKREIDGHYDTNDPPVWIHTATLKHAEVLYVIHPTIYAEQHQPYYFSGVVPRSLDIVVDGGGTQTVNFLPGMYDASEIIEKFVGLIGVHAVVTGPDDDPFIKLVATATGRSATLQVTGGTANSVFRFPIRPFYGGDDLSAIYAPDAHFTEEDSGLSIEITGAVDPLNNGLNQIISVQNASLALLRYAITDEIVGFNARIVGALWKSSILIDGITQFAYTAKRGEYVPTNDIVVNVSKLTGYHDVAFELELINDLV